MALLKKKEDKKPFVARASAGGSGTEISPLRPLAVEKQAPCIAQCPSGNDIRGWLTTIAQRDKLGLTLDQACEQAWRTAVDTNPFPAVMGRVCPHPCEGVCNRTGKDEAVGINSVERFIGDFGLDHTLAAAANRGRRSPQPRKWPSSAPDRRGSRAPISSRGAATRSPSSSRSRARAACCATASPNTGCRARCSTPRFSASSTWASICAARPRSAARSRSTRCAATIRRCSSGLARTRGATSAIPGEDGAGVFTGHAVPQPRQRRRAGRTSANAWWSSAAATRPWMRPAPACGSAPTRRRFRDGSARR